ncbi:hypothetical protein FRC04_008473 [Tulasnella sp. 424]|nr:hypothetical protein FRC04_008473 [Tulasnella sp. 424]
MADNATLTTHSTPDNVDCLINRLPTELLTLLLKFALLRTPRSSLRSDFLYHNGFLYYVELSSIRLVCKKWQRIVETDPSFWIYISTSLPPLLLKKVVECAPGTKSLVVRYDSTSQLLAVDHGILQLSEYWTSLYIQLASPERLFQFLKQPIPHLRRLHVQNTGNLETYEGVESGFQTISLPLEILKVRESTFPWGLIAFTDLLEIDVEGCDGCPYFSQGFIDVLRSSPRLQSLRLRSCRTDLQPQTSIILPHLASIDFTDSPEAVRLFKAITCPSSARISIFESAQSLSTQNPWVVAALDHTNFECTENVHLELEQDIEVGVHVGNIDLTLQSEYPAYDPASIPPFCTNILKPFSETNGGQVTTLELDLQLNWNVAPLISKLDSFFPNITALELRCFEPNPQISSSIFDVLSRPFVREDGEPTWLLPRVEKLRFGWAAGPRPQPLANGVMEIIRSRCSPEGASGVIRGDLSSPKPSRLRELSLEKCTMLRSEGQELRSIFGDAVEFINVSVRDVRGLYIETSYRQLIEV